MERLLHTDSLATSFLVGRRVKSAYGMLASAMARKPVPGAVSGGSAVFDLAFVAETLQAAALLSGHTRSIRTLALGNLPAERKACWDIHRMSMPAFGKMPAVIRVSR